MTIQSLSDLSQIDRDAYTSEASEYLQTNMGQYLEEHFLSIVSFYVKSTVSTEKRGYVLISVVQPDELSDKEIEELDTDRCLFWRKKFIPFEAVMGIDSQSDLFFSQIKMYDPCQMPVVFFDSRERVPFRGKIFRADCKLTIHYIFSLGAQTDDVVKERSDRTKERATPRRQPERNLEDDLYDWLRVNGVEVERQVSTAKHRLDLWIPSKAMLELKQGRVSGDDVCQAIDYASTYQMPIVLVGSGLSSAASRGIDGFNRAISKDLIIFVTWGGVKPYLNGLLKMLN